MQNSLRHLALLFALSTLFPGASAFAQAPGEAGPGGATTVDEAARLAEAALAEGQTQENQTPPPASALPAPDMPTLFELQFQGGALMWPIAFMAVLVGVFGIERFLGLRRRKVLPPELVAELGNAAGDKGGLDPRKTYKICQHFPSAAASVIRAALLKVGRPHSEVEHAVKDASEREAARLYANVRPINLAVAVSPLLGLLGTVQGMIMAFAQTAAGVAGSNKAEQLASGIYIALVTTFAGLCVAIPAAVLSHYFEGRIQTLFREIDELLLGMLPQLERYEGKLRLNRVESNRPDTPRQKKPEAEAAKQPVVSQEG